MKIITCLFVFQKRIKTLMTNMAAMVSEEVRDANALIPVLSDLQLIQDQSELTLTAVCWQGRLTASAVGQIVGLQSEEIKQMASEYAEKVSVRGVSSSPRKRDHRIIVTEGFGQLKRDQGRLEHLMQLLMDPRHMTFFRLDPGHMTSSCPFSAV